MNGVRTSLLTWSALALFPAAFASAQVVPAPAAPAAPVGTPPAPQPQAVPAPPVELPPPVWEARDAEELLAFIQQVGGDGLDPTDYDAPGLAAALRTGSVPVFSQAATDRFNRLSWDIALGRVDREERVGWHVVDKDLDTQRQSALLRTALQQHRVGDALRGLLPTHPQYRDLKNALMITPRTETAQINRLRLNLERWRWLPRDLGSKYIIVNVPAYYVSLVENGATQWRERAVAGAIKTPTPMLSALATGVILNPWWEVPKSIEPEVRGKAGFVALRGKDGKIQRWRQPPGPSNALGQLKFVMPNSHAIYLHDTNARSRFNDKIRSLSHGCIRTKDVVGLAKTIFTDEANPEWTPEKVDAALESKKTIEAKFVQPIPVYIVYFSSAASVDGKIINYQDVYKRDAQVLASLDGRPATTKTKVAAR